MMALGGVIVIAAIILNLILKRWQKKLSILGLAIGIYLPIASSTPLFIGGLIALLTKKGLQKRASQYDPQQLQNRKHRGSA